MNITKLARKLFCRHNYLQIGFKQECDGRLRFSVRHYKCEKCGKTIWVDGRHDTYHI